ncbi:hypothetical protein [Cellulomonas carbonis]|uniref:Uncharacterized protein n=1 Tax=Cellulomonas carbonis T26 TaxID=947969 RepID=A0A0A0BZA9_9CELL|nr:hypothetical protein [Cellulomonas carbonis]KGM12529.1 hypothetical protein N868_09675 [Cellulomonas carbonis T26]GGB93723.1 hypothetical protein GCM10010972_02990 [Cellulomonas carbonis]
MIESDESRVDPDGPTATGGHDVHDDVPVLEADETVPPRPEEEVADVARSRPDPAGHGGGDGDG